MRSVASCRAHSARRRATWSSRSHPSWPAASSIRTTRGRRSSAAGGCPTCCSPATTPRSTDGGGSSPARAHADADPKHGWYHSSASDRRGRPVTVIQDIENRQRRDVPQFKAGDPVRVHFKVIEGSRSRVQVFEGICIKRQGEGVRETFTVRKKSFNEVFVERTFPVHSPRIEKIDVASIGDVSRAKLYYLRDKVGKAARVREKSR